ncbi:hypothetical protein [Candidatus Phytoplasma sp. AldY-WA1]|jgi:hypothetical protein|nr:hypothetical protein [Candidatus Phytoplasma sp. AldY-WA1]
MTYTQIIETIIASFLGSLIIFSAGLVIGYKHRQHDKKEGKNQLE